MLGSGEMHVADLLGHMQDPEAPSKFFAISEQGPMCQGVLFGLNITS